MFIGNIIIDFVTRKMKCFFFAFSRIFYLLEVFDRTIDTAGPFRRILSLKLNISSASTYVTCIILDAKVT